MKELTKLGLIVAVVATAWAMPIGEPRVQGAILEAFAMLHEYARDHILLCLVPAFFIAGAISVFVSQASVMKYLGAGASKWISYPVAAVSGTILAVCSCTVLPLFSGIHKRGAGLGPATAFLYSGPAINVLAIILTARVLGMELGIARAVGAVVFAVVIGLLMHLFFRKEEEARVKAAAVMPEALEPARRLRQDGLYFAAMVGILVFANWGRPAGETSGFWYAVWSVKWFVTGFFALGLVAMLWRWFKKDELGDWVSSSWTFAKQIMPLLLGGVLVAGLLLGRPGHEGLIPSEWVATAVGGNSIWANLFASIAGAFMYFATLTEVPILQGLIGSGMGKGPALTLLLAGPALSLPSMIVIRSVLGSKKTMVYVALVVVMSTFVGFAYGAVF